MSKKLAASLDALVLDVKVGSAAFMRTLPQARALARSLVATGKRMKVRTHAFISDMNQPLGRMVGNACEANEAMDTLRGEGPPEVLALTLALAEQLLLSAGRFQDPLGAHRELRDALTDGRALTRFQRMVEAQGGAFAEHLELAPAYVLEASQSGWVEAMDGQLLGQTVIELGGGRRQLNEPIDPGVGLEMLVRVGTPITQGQPLLRYFARNRLAAKAAHSALQAAVRLGENPTADLPLFYRLPDKRSLDKP